MWTLDPVSHLPSPVSPLVDLLPLLLGPETPPLSLKELRLCWLMLWQHDTSTVVDKYIFQWRRDPLIGCSVNHHGNITASGTDGLYVIENLHEDSTYFISVTAINGAGSNVSNITAMTRAAGI